MGFKITLLLKTLFHEFTKHSYLILIVKLLTKAVKQRTQTDDKHARIYHNNPVWKSFPSFSLRSMKRILHSKTGTYIYMWGADSIALNIFFARWFRRWAHIWWPAFIEASFYQIIKINDSCSKHSIANNTLTWKYNFWQPTSVFILTTDVSLLSRSQEPLRFFVHAGNNG